MKRNGAHQNAKGPSDTPLCGPSVSDEAPVSSNRPATILASGTIVLVLVAISLCFGEMVIQAVHLLSNDHLSVESMKNKAGLITSDPNFGGHATEHDGDVLTEITLSGTRHRDASPPPFYRSSTGSGFCSC
jgi:hypothetical protein